VFPEYGLMPLFFTSRQEATVFMEYVPHPQFDNSVPCLAPTADPDPIPIQRSLSCIAFSTGMYVVANMGALGACSSCKDSACPEDRRYQFNTNVAYDPTGRLVARYRKYNLFLAEELIYDQPKTAELVYFDTPFGRVGTFICFDIIFGEPAMSLAEKANISLVAFTTAWMTELPYYSAGSFHQGYAAATGLNVLAANIHDPSWDFCGSGVYGWDGLPRAFRCIDDHSSAVIIADVTTSSLTHDDRPVLSSAHLPTTVEGVPDFSAPVFRDPFNFVLLQSNTGINMVCHNDLCCWLNYTKTQNSNDQFALGAFRGLHTFEGAYYIEVCSLMICQTGASDTHCGVNATSSSTKFRFFNLTGNFSSRYVYPQVVVSGVKPTTDAWHFTRGVGTLVLPRPSTTAVLSATLYARRFDWDDCSRSADAGRIVQRDIIYLFIAMMTWLAYMSCTSDAKKVSFFQLLSSSPNVLA